MAKKDEPKETNVVEPVVKKTEPEQRDEGVKEDAPDYEKRFGELQSTISEQGKTIEEMQEFVSGASVVINTIASDPNLKQGFQTAFGKQYGVQGQQPQQDNPPQQGYQPSQPENQDVTRKVDDVVSSQRENIIREFESNYGIDNTDSGKATRQKVAEHLSGWGWTVKDLPLTSLRDSLEKAYIGSVGVEKLREEGKLEGIVQARTNAQGVMGSFGGGSPNSGGQTNELTDKQQEWIKKLRVDSEGAKKVYNERDQEQEREKGAK